MTLRLASPQGTETADASFAREVMKESQAHLERCYQCQACSSGCMFAYTFDYAPHQLLRMVQLGLKDRVLDSTTIWMCASCETCATRCPNDIEIVRVMDTLRTISLKEGRTAQTSLPLFHNTFLSNVRSNGKLYELMLILRYMLQSRDILNLKIMAPYVTLGPKMFLKRKLALMPPKVKGMASIKQIFKRTEKKNG